MELPCGAGWFIGGSGCTMFGAELWNPPADDWLPEIGGSGCNVLADDGAWKLLFAGQDFGWPVWGATGPGYDAGRTEPRVKIEPSAEVGGNGLTSSLRFTG